MARESVELNELDAGTPRGGVKSENAENAENRIIGPRASSAVESALPPVDRGKEARRFLAACWVVEALIFGFGIPFGVFQKFYSTHEPFASSGNIPVIGTTTTVRRLYLPTYLPSNPLPSRARDLTRNQGTMYLATPFALVLCRLYPRWARWSTLAGLFAASLFMAMSSFCTSVPQLIATQGFLFGISGCVAFCPCQLYIDEWFAQRKGLATASCGAPAASGVSSFPCSSGPSSLTFLRIYCPCVWNY
ncbi:Uu.00g107920.m01.CDS01 [Anthostomella pinea]|uniref:Uu.00g107920.m01.CDS01 n=1 Tax=Anthostomella pinea TaxID=933095 RepID=A0AAI8VFE0_9PEZI|nr:Uu.00g107920.m01.CDS01 [Anthostomella pinea]